MTEEEKINALIDELHKLIERAGSELELTTVSIVGSLEFVKADYLDTVKKVKRKKA